MLNRLLFGASLVLMLAACQTDRTETIAGDVDAGADRLPPPEHDSGLDAPSADADPLPIELSFDGGFARKSFVRAGGRGLAVLIEPPLSLRVDFGRPRRELRLLNAQGSDESVARSSPNRELLDATEHESGELTLIYASTAGFSLVRLDANGKPLAETSIDDPDIDSDPPARSPNAPPSAPIGWYTHDTGRVAAVADDVLVATRNGRDSVIAYRFAFENGEFSRTQRALAMPSIYISPIGLTGGTYDTFGQLEASFAIHLAVAPSGSSYVGIRHPGLGAEQIPEVLKSVFGEEIEGDPDGFDVYVVRFAADGRRLGTSVVTTPEYDEIYGLRAFEDGAYVVGRTEHWNEQGTGFDAIVGRVDQETGASSVVELDIAQGDVAFDLVKTPAGMLVVGASDYAQNPHGASITEHSRNFARLRQADGSSRELGVRDGPRHNETRFVLDYGPSRLLVGGMLDGPGTHSADQDATLLRARGFLTEIVLD